MADVVTYGMYRYRLVNFLITIEGMNTTFPAGYDHIQSIIIDKDFDNLMIPLFMVEIKIPNAVHRKMKDSNIMYVDVTFQKGPAEEAMNLEATKNAPFSNYINGKFVAIIKDKSPDVLDSQIEKYEKTFDNYGIGNEVHDSVVIKLLLYKHSHWESFGNPINNIITSCTLIDAMTYVLNKSKLTGILLSPPDNNKIYKEFIVTPISAMEQLDRICNEYGFHNSGTVIFFDFNYIYVVSKVPECTAFYTNEYKYTYLMSKSASSLNSTISSGCAYDSKSKINMLNIIGNTIQVEKLSDANDKIYGNNFMCIDTATGNIKSIDSGTGSNKIGQVVMINRGDDTSGAVKQNLYEASNIFTMGFSHIDLDMLTPNKCYITSFEDAKLSKYNGKVRLNKMTIIFSKEGAYFIPQVTAQFKG